MPEYRNADRVRTRRGLVPNAEAARRMAGRVSRGGSSADERDDAASRQRQRLFRAAQTVRSVPVAAVEALRLLHQPDVDLGKVVPVIERDPGWTANLLRVANSAYFGCSRSVKTVKEAFIRLGMRTVFQLVVGSAFLPVLRAGIRVYGVGGVSLEHHCIGVGNGVKSLADRLRYPLPEHAFTAAVLHDVGKIVLSRTAAKMRRELQAGILEKRLETVEVERGLLGTDHAEMGAYVLGRWDLPDEMVRVARWHHDPDGLEEPDTVVDLLHAVDRIAIGVEMESSDVQIAATVLPTVVQRLGLRIDHVAAIREELADIFAKSNPLGF